MTRLFAFAIIAVCLANAQIANAAMLTITPNSGSLVEFGSQTGTSDILAELDVKGYIDYLGGPPSAPHNTNALTGVIEQYKQDVGVSTDAGPLAASYKTEFTNTPSDPSGAHIQYEGYPNVAVNTIDPTYLLVKDGNSDPAWYFFDLTAAGWSGIDTIELLNFWPANGAISHVSIFGKSTFTPPEGTPPSSVPVPEPASLALWLAGMDAVMIRRKRST